MGTEQVKDRRNKIRQLIFFPQDQPAFDFLASNEIQEKCPDGGLN